MSTSDGTALRPIGLIVNPRSGNDVRRVIASAGSSTLEEKVSIVRRVAKGAAAVGATHFVTNVEPHQIVRRALETSMSRSGGGLVVDRIDEPLTHTEEDTTRAAARMREAGCVAVVVLGGDGTNRAAAKGWPDLPVIPLSTGTNNAFPYWVEPTVAGAAAGLLATGVVADDAAVLRRAKVVHVAIQTTTGPDEQPEVALIDAVAVADRWVGSLELFEPDTMRVAVLTRADPAAIGFSAVGGLLVPCAEQDDHGVLVRFAPVADSPPIVLRAPTAPGHYADVGVLECRALPEGESIEVHGPVLLAFDGERKRRLHEGERALLTLRRDGPRVVDVAAVMAAAARLGSFVRQSS
jgi:predicted polyphosphate/ATP-dependent NAD kinase